MLLLLLLLLPLLLLLLLLLLPAHSQVEEAIISHGCTVKRSVIKNAVVGLRSHIEEGCTLHVSDMTN
jgi:competence protein ComGC